jgi:lipopolysaccharide biosynthesis regulator YciM
MHLHKGWQPALGIMVLCIASMSPIPLAVAQTQTQSSTPLSDCTEQRGQILERLTRDLIYRSQQYVRSGQFDLAARSLEQALQIVATVEEPFAKTDIVANIAGETGAQPGTLQQLVDHAIATQQPDIPLDLLPKIVNATQTLDGEYAVINVKRAIFVQLAQYYTVLEQPESARSLLDQARQLLDSLHGDGFGLIAAPVAEGYAALGDNQAAIEILNQAVQRTEAMTTNEPDYLSDIYSAIATAYARARANQQALQVAQRVQLAAVKARTLAAIANHSAQAGSSTQLAQTQITQTLTQALSLAQTLPAASRSNILSQIALVYGQLGQWDKALEQAEAIASAEVKIQTLATLASMSDRANRPSEYARFLSSIDAIAQTIVPFYNGDAVLRQIFTEYIANQQYELAFQFSQSLDGTLQDNLLLKLVEEASAAGEFAIALQAAEAVPPGWENQTRSIALRSVATGYAQAGQYTQALQLLSQIGDTSGYPSRVLTHVAIAQAYRKDEQPELAIEQLNQALQALQPLENSYTKLDALSLIAVQFAQLNQPERAAEVQTQTLETAKTLQPNASYGVEQLVKQYLNAEEYALALQLVETIENEFEHDRFLQSILQQMVEVGDLPSVLQAADAIRNPNQKIAFWVKLADYYRGMGQAEQAADILAKAFAIAQALSGPDANSFAEAAQLDPSIPIEDEFDRGSLIEAIAIRYAELGQDDVAQQTAQALRSSSDRARLIQRLACYAKPD